MKENVKKRKEKKKGPKKRNWGHERERKKRRVKESGERTNCRGTKEQKQKLQIYMKWKHKNNRKNKENKKIVYNKENTKKSILYLFLMMVTLPWSISAKEWVHLKRQIIILYRICYLSRPSCPLHLSPNSKHRHFNSPDSINPTAPLFLLL